MSAALLPGLAAFFSLTCGHSRAICSASISTTRRSWKRRPRPCLHPPLPRNAYRTEEEWTAAQNDYSHIDRERLSDCFGVFTLARMDDARSWKAIYTDRCIERNAWTPMVAVWDGEDMRIHLNGIDAKDKWRVQGKGAVPL